MNCYGEENCEAMVPFLEMNEELKNEVIELMDQPKIHGSMITDFILIPLCSFALNKLSECNLFKASTVKFQDYTCFTFDQSLQTQASKDNGLKLVLNLKNMPQGDTSLSLKMYIHEPGSIPDVLSLNSNYLTIRANKKTNIGVNIIKNDMTDNFNEMPFEKRQCITENDIIQENGYDYGQYSSLHCLVNEIHKSAAKACNCLPSTFNSSIYPEYPHCNMSGSYCFRKAISEAKKDPKNDYECPQRCKSTKYEATKIVDTYSDPFEYGDEYIAFLANNPTGLLLRNDTWEWKTYHGFIKKSSGSYSLINIFFDSPQMTVIIKDAKVTVPDMISNIGDTIGIFLGMSTISLLDLLTEWVQKIYQRFLHKRNLSF